MKKINTFIFFFLFSFILFGKEDSLFVRIKNDTLQIWNTDVEANCASRFGLSVLFSSTIIVTEIDTVGPLANCMCSYDLHASLTGLPAGEYTVSVYREEKEEYHYPKDTAIFIGELNFTLENSSLPQSTILFQSGCNAPAGESFTAQYLYPAANADCQEMREGAKLRNIYSDDVSVDGSSAAWHYMFSWYDQQNERLEYLYFHNEQSAVVFDSISLIPDCCVMYITEEWFDSDSALAYAEANGGQAFRGEFPDYVIEATLSQALVPYSYPCWSVVYASRSQITRRLTFYFDARKNSSIHALFYPETDTLYLLSGCTEPEFSLNLAPAGAADKISLIPGFNTSAMTKDSAGNYTPVDESYFIVILSPEKTYEYEIWFHPMSYPPFDPILIQLDSAFHTGQQKFEIQLITKLDGVPVDSFTQAFIADFGLNVNPENILPGEFVLFQNHPNPFNPITHFGFRVANSGFVSLKIYDVLGNEVAVLVNEEKPAGNYEIKFDCGNLSSGVYFYRLQAGSFSDTKKLILLK